MKFLVLINIFFRLNIIFCVHFFFGFRSFVGRKYVLGIWLEIVIKVFRTFSSSFKLAGDTSECLLSSALRGGASPVPSAPSWLMVCEPSLASLCLRGSDSRTGTSRSESVDSWGTIGCPLEASFLLQTLHRHTDWKFKIFHSLKHSIFKYFFIFTYHYYHRLINQKKKNKEIQKK